MRLEIAISPDSLQHMPILWMRSNSFFKEARHPLGCQSNTFGLTSIYRNFYRCELDMYSGLRVRNMGNRQWYSSLDCK
jgi:hypothetical protein